MGSYVKRFRPFFFDLAVDYFKRHVLVRLNDGVEVCVNHDDFGGRGSGRLLPLHLQRG